MTGQATTVARPQALQDLASVATQVADDIRRAGRRAVRQLDVWNAATTSAHHVPTAELRDAVETMGRLVLEADHWAGAVGDALVVADEATFIFDFLATSSQRLQAIWSELPDDTMWRRALVATLRTGTTDPADLQAWGTDHLLAVGSDPDLAVDLRHHANVAALAALVAEPQTAATGMAANQVPALRELVTLLDSPAGHGLRLLSLRPAPGPHGELTLRLVVGDLGAADQVAHLLPGTGHGAHTWAADVGTARDLADAARAASPGTRTAIVLDLYDAPDDIVPDAFSGRYADQHADSLAAFVAEERRLAGEARMTVIGHSYGSLVAGRGGATGMPAHATVLVGSPGVGEDHASDVLPTLAALPDGTIPAANGVFVARAPRDEILLAADGQTIARPFHVGAWHDRFAHGTDPADGSFGASTFEVNPPCTPHHDPLFVAGHSSYFLPGSRSMQNIARIIVGEPPTLPSSSSLDNRLLHVSGPDASLGERAWNRATVQWNLGTDGYRGTP